MSNSDQKNKTISGFSKLSKRGKIKWLLENFFKDPESVFTVLSGFWHDDDDQQKILDGFSENTISNFPIPFGVAPNFLINGEHYAVPMVIEESSVVAAAASAAKYWLDRGGFHTKVIGTTKLGQLHFNWFAEEKWLDDHFADMKDRLIKNAGEITKNMRARGGGIKDIALKKFPDREQYYQIIVSCETCNSMGANFINSVLEDFSESLTAYVGDHYPGAHEEFPLEVIMCILSNYTPDCIVEASVSCPVDNLGSFPNDMSASEFARRFCQAVEIAEFDPYRAVTHNKGIFNGIDAVIIATGNDFRAIEACGHAYAARDGQYRSLSHAEVVNGEFRFHLRIPLAIGTVGGLTGLHPIAKMSLEMLDHPDADTLMGIIASTGLAQNFGAVRSLVTTGIQHGHMKMHLENILGYLKATEAEAVVIREYFVERTISYNAVQEQLENIRK